MDYTYEIKQDTDASNPRDEYDNLSTFYGPNGSRYLVGGKHDHEVYDLEETIKAFRKAGAVIVEFQADAGTRYAVVERDQLFDEYIKFGQTMRQALYHARQCAKREIETWKAWCDGEVYGYIVTDEDGETVDSCWGFYGEAYARQEAESFIAWKVQDDAKQAQLINACWAE